VVGQGVAIRAGALAALAGVAVAASAAATSSAAPALFPVRAPNCLTAARVACFTPQRFRTAYAIGPLLGRGIDGRGRTVAIIDGVPTRSSAPPITDIRSDLGAYDAHYGLPAPPRFRIVAPFNPGTNTSLAINEEVIDVEMVHTVAPGAAIVVVLVKPHGRAFAPWFKAFRDAIRYASARADVVSLSYSWGQRCFTRAAVGSTHRALQAVADRHVTFVESSGDYGVVGKPCGFGKYRLRRETGYPVSDPLVLAAGGTRLIAGRNGSYRREVVWNRPPEPGKGPKFAHSEASGGGFGKIFKTPGYQSEIPGIAGGRGVPDVSADAAKATGLALVKVVDGRAEIDPASGTSAAAPLWAALAALADQYAHRRLGFLNPTLYAIARGGDYRRAFHDVTRGSNTVIFNNLTFLGFTATRGWDPATGWGSPIAAALVPLLAARGGH
jgi:subtilase family serine protease